MAERVVPPSRALTLSRQESDGIFVASAFNSYEQTRGSCTGLIADGACTSDADCVAQRVTANGVLTGVCDTVAQLCEIEGWCPPEPASANATVLTGVVRCPFVGTDVGA